MRYNKRNRSFLYLWDDRRYISFSKIMGTQFHPHSIWRQYSQGWISYRNWNMEIGVDLLLVSLCVGNRQTYVSWNYLMNSCYECTQLRAHRESINQRSKCKVGNKHPLNKGTILGPIIIYVFIPYFSYMCRSSFHCFDQSSIWKNSSNRE